LSNHILTTYAVNYSVPVTIHYETKEMFIVAKQHPQLNVRNLENSKNVILNLLT